MNKIHKSMEGFNEIYPFTRISIIFCCNNEGQAD